MAAVLASGAGAAVAKAAREINARAVSEVSRSKRLKTKREIGLLFGSARYIVMLQERLKVLMDGSASCFLFF